MGLHTPIPEDPESAITDLITNLLHLGSTDLANFDADAMMRRCLMHFRAESSLNKELP